MIFKGCEFIMAFEAKANSGSKSRWLRYINPANWFKGIWNFIVESKNELKRITWPEKSRVFRSTGVVISTILVLTLFIWLCDSVFGFGLNNFLSAIK